MNWKIVAGGSFIIFIVFISFIGFEFIKNRDNSLNIPEDKSVFTYLNVDRNLPENQKIAKQNESDTHKRLMRGTVTQFNPDTNIFSMAVETKQPNGTMGVIGVLEVRIDPNRIKEFSCWPEHKQTANGVNVDIKSTFISMGPDNILYLSGETKKEISDIEKHFNKSPFVFAYLSTNLEGEDTLTEIPVGTGLQDLNQLAILNCDETN